MPKRDPLDDLPPDLAEAVRAVVHDATVRELGVADPAAFTGQLERDELNVDDRRDYHLRALTTLKAVASYADSLITPTGELAAAYGAQTADLAGALNISRQGVHKRWGRADPSLTKVVVVISRTDTVHHVPDDAREYIGEVGGAAQYDSDRGWWAIGHDVRAAARYAVIGVDGITERVYRIDPDGWTQNPDNGKWQFRAVDDQPLNMGQIAKAAAFDSLPFTPGEPCPRRYMNAYLPRWFA